MCEVWNARGSVHVVPRYGGGQREAYAGVVCLANKKPASRSSTRGAFKAIKPQKVGTGEVMDMRSMRVVTPETTDG